MFWGLVLKANKKYTQTIKKSFHLSQAALDISSCTDEFVQVFITSENEKYLICTLKKNKCDQVALDLNFQEGDEISFHAQGGGNVHLSGYVIEDEPSDMEDFMGMDDEEESETEEIAQLPKSKKAENGKKQKAAVPVPAEDDEELEEEESDDSDFDGEQVEDEEEEDGDDEEGEEEEEEDDSEEEEVQEPKAKQAKLDKSAKQNGVENGKVASKEKAKKDKKQAQPEKPQKGGEKTIAGGVKVEDIRVGNGAEAKPGKKVQVYYEGRLKSNNKVFDSTKQGAGFKFALGRGEVIKAWDVGVSGMKVGGKRRITCPPHMAYGARGSPPVIPPNSTLVFEVELKNVN